MPIKKRPDQSLKILHTITDPTPLYKAATADPPFGPAVLQKADRLEVWGTTEDAPEDYTEFRLL